MQDMTSKSKFLSLVLRHKPEMIGITLDHFGWADVKELIEKMNLDQATLDEIVKTDSKQRYAYNEDKTKIRASQGHSIYVDLGLKPIKPLAILYHGTAMKFADAIREQGIKAQKRQYVHLSKDIGTAKRVGGRHGDPFVFKIDADRMHKDGKKFFISANGVWLTEFVDKEYFI
jgi:putative RNA 2'-phosphotransferase